MVTKTKTTTTTAENAKPRRARVPLAPVSNDVSFEDETHVATKGGFVPNEALLEALKATHESGGWKSAPVAALGGSRRAAESNIRRHAARLNIGVMIRDHSSDPSRVSFRGKDKNRRRKPKPVVVAVSDSTTES